MKRPKPDPRQASMWAAALPPAEQVPMFASEPSLALSADVPPKKKSKEPGR